MCFRPAATSRRLLARRLRHAGCSGRSRRTGGRGHARRSGSLRRSGGARSSGGRRHARAVGAGHEVRACLFGKLGPALGTRLVVGAARRIARRTMPIQFNSGRSETHAHHSFRSHARDSRRRCPRRAPTCAWEPSLAARMPRCAEKRNAVRGPAIWRLRPEHNAWRQHRFRKRSWESYMDEEIARHRLKPSYPLSEQSGDDAKIAAFHLLKALTLPNSTPRDPPGGRLRTFLPMPSGARRKGPPVNVRQAAPLPSAKYGLHAPATREDRYHAARPAFPTASAATCAPSRRR